MTWKTNLLLFLLLFFSLCVKTGEVVKVSGKRALLIIACENFRDEEYLHTREELEKAGVSVRVASTRKGTCTGMFGTKASAELSLDEVVVDEYDAIIFIGGSGVPSVRANPKSVEIVKEAYEKGKVLAAICWAPTILAKAGVLEGKRATVWNGPDREFGMSTSEYLESKGAKYTGNPVEVDGKIITANGPAAARDFGRAIVRALQEAS